MQLLVRILGLGGLVLCVLPFQFKKHKHIVLCKMVSELMFAGQYLLLGAYTGAVVDLISGARNFIFYKCVEKNRSTIPAIVGFSALVIALGVASWAGPLSLLPIAAKLLTTVSYGMKKERLLRLITLPSCLCWIAYNFAVGTWEAMIGDGLALASILVAMYKYDLSKKQDDKK